MTKDMSNLTEHLKEKILIVEDNTTNALLMRRILERIGYFVVVAAHGREALDIVNEHKDIAAILMDCQMPVMDGYDATRQLRSIETFKSTPIIAVTGDDSEDNQSRCYEAGMSDYLLKPISKALIKNTLLKWLKP